MDEQDGLSGCRGILLGVVVSLAVWGLAFVLAHGLRLWPWQ